MVIIRIARNINTDLDYIIRTGLGFSIDGMKKAKRFDPDNPNCSGKNNYFNQANYVCNSSLWQLDLYDLCERYYARLLSEIKKYEMDNSTNFNKGMVYANLGVSQIAQGKIDKGFANILKAQIEDKPCHKTDPSYSVFKNPLYMQFEDGKEGLEGIKDYVLKHSQLYQKEESKTIDKALLGKLVLSMDTDSHILFISVVEKIRRNFEILADKDNRFTRLQIFLCLQDLCLAVENALKTKNRIAGDLKNLVDALFSKKKLGRRLLWKRIFDDNYPSLSHASSVSELRDSLKKILKEINDNKARRLLICCLVRNFSAHNLDVGDDYIFKKKELIFDNVISSILFLYDSGYI